MWKFLIQIIRVLFEPGAQNIDPEPYNPKPAPQPEPVVVPPVPVEPPKPPKTAARTLYEYALAQIGKDASPADVAPDEYGCAETVCNIIHECFGDFPLEGGVIISTADLYKKLKKHPKFTQIAEFGPGDVLVSPTGYGNGGLANGHTGIVGENNVIMSNDSATGLFKENYTIESWVARYRKIGGFPLYFFRRISP